MKTNCEKLSNITISKFLFLVCKLLADLFINTKSFAAAFYKLQYILIMYRNWYRNYEQILRREENDIFLLYEDDNELNKE